MESQVSQSLRDCVVFQKRQEFIGGSLMWQKIQLIEIRFDRNSKQYDIMFTSVSNQKLPDCAVIVWFQGDGDLVESRWCELQLIENRFDRNTVW